MGEEIATSSFSADDFADYRARLAHETDLLARWIEREELPACDTVGGYELEVCLTDRTGRAAPANETFLRAMRSDLVVPELAQFDLEINAQPQPLRGRALRRLHDDLQATWDHCRHIAATLDVELLMVGILPTLVETELSLARMTAQRRYHALNEQVMRLRRGEPIAIDIEGRQHLRTTHRDVMLESAATSLQVHMQVSPAQAARLYNAAIILSAPMVAASANSPYLFGYDLWDETRIPLFEQSVGSVDVEDLSRVSLGRCYVRDSLAECFRENVALYPVLLPILKEEPSERLRHLRLHNGTVWRWNRPLVGFDADGRASLRIEHRVMPAGPSVIDTIANAALFFGCAYALITAEYALEDALDFEHARTNFYRAARDGLAASLVWPGAGTLTAQQLLLGHLLPLARAGLAALEIDSADTELYLGVIEARVRSGQNGAAWQRAYVQRHGPDMQQLTCAYRDRQRTGAPVHEWSI